MCGVEMVVGKDKDKDEWQSGGMDRARVWTT